MNKHIAAYTCIVSIWQMSQNWSLFELNEIEIQFVFLTLM